MSTAVTPSVTTWSIVRHAGPTCTLHVHRLAKLVDDGHLESSPHSERPFHHPSHPLFERTSWIHPTDLGCPGRPPRRVGVGGPHRRRASRPPDFDALAHAFEPTPRQTRVRLNPSGEPMHEPPQTVRDRMGSEVLQSKENDMKLDTKASNPPMPSRPTWRPTGPRGDR